jgi:hypothetical protein
MRHFNLPSSFFNNDDDSSTQTRAVISEEELFEHTTLRWAMKNQGMQIEIKRAEGLASTRMVLRLLKSNREAMSITDNKIEKGLFELEEKIITENGMRASKELQIVLQLLRRGTMTLPPHDDLRNEIIMKGCAIRLGYMGPDEESGRDMFGGLLLSKDGDRIASTSPQRSLGRILDHLVNALFNGLRETYRKAIGKKMIEIREQYVKKPEGGSGW